MPTRTGAVVEAPRPEAGAELTSIRQALGLSQRAMARRLGVHYVTVNNWEAGRGAVPNPVLYLARCLIARPDVALPPTSPYVWVPPDPHSVGLDIQPGSKCAWESWGHCAGTCFRWRALVSPHVYLQGDACETHLYAAYTALVERLRKELTKRAAKDAAKDAEKGGGGDAHADTGSARPGTDH